MSTNLLRALLGTLTREQLERVLAQLAATAPDHFEIALRVLSDDEDDEVPATPDTPAHPFVPAWPGSTSCEQPRPGDLPCGRTPDAPVHQIGGAS